MEANVIYPIRTLSQLPPILKGFRKEKGLTQVAVAEKLGITQQSYAYFEAHPTTATLDRLFMVLRILNVEISLHHASLATGMDATPSVKPMGQKISKTSGRGEIGKEKPSAVAQAGRTVSPPGKKENW